MRRRYGPSPSSSEVGFGVVRVAFPDIIGKGDIAPPEAVPGGAFEA
jgi:hypothetical protein